MKNLIARLPAFDPDKKCVNVVIETPKGSCIKYAYDAECGLFALKRALPQGFAFPFNFGFVPSTLGEDGDPLDILILNEEPLFPGCLVKTRLIGVIKAKQTEDGGSTRNDRLIGLAIGKETPADLKSVDLDKKTLAQIEFFFVAYNKLDGKKFKILGKAGPKRAKAIIQSATTSQRKKKKKAG